MSLDTNHVRALILSNAHILIEPSTTADSTPPDQIDVIVFGAETSFTAVVMRGMHPAIQGEKATTPETALRKLLMATSELLRMYLPKVGAHQRNIHGGGVFDDDFIRRELAEGQSHGA